MKKEELEKLAELIAGKLNSIKNDEEIYIDEICRLTGYKRGTIYQMRDKLPLQKRGNKLYSTRSAILAYNQTR